MVDGEMLRYEAAQLLAEGRERNFPFGLCYCAVHVLFRKRGITPPTDVLAFVSDGKCSDAMVRDWYSPPGKA